MSRQQLQDLLALAEHQPALRRRLRLQGSWQHWLEQVQALGFQITAADLQQAYDEDHAQRFFNSSQLPAIRPLPCVMGEPLTGPAGNDRAAP